MEPASATPWIAGEVEESRAHTDFDAVVREYWPRVFRFVLVSLRDRGDAESLTQDCFLKAFRAWGSFRGDSSINTWLMRIAVNQIRDHARSRRLQFWKRTRDASREAHGTRDSLSDGRVSPETGAAAKEQVEAVWHAAANLPEQQKSVFLLRFVEDLDLLEIAAATGLKEGTVKAHLFRALQTIRARMREAR
ncbi:MAG: sigma-70 family RNA polymerase sigma factor [Acidobacteriota bacterium]